MKYEITLQGKSLKERIEELEPLELLFFSKYRENLDVDVSDDMVVCESGIIGIKPKPTEKNHETLRFFMSYDNESIKTKIISYRRLIENIYENYFDERKDSTVILILNHMRDNLHYTLKDNLLSKLERMIHKKI